MHSRGRRFSPELRRRLVAGALLGYLAVVAFGVFGPEPGDSLRKAGGGLRRVSEGIGDAVPGRLPVDVQHGEQEERLYGRLTNEAVANVVMFIPFGLLFPLSVPSLRRWTIPTGVGLSAAIEAVQLFLPRRSPSLDDIALNSLGAVIGFSLWLAACAWQRRRGDSGGRAAGATIEAGQRR